MKETRFLEGGRKTQNISIEIDGPTSPRVSIIIVTYNAATTLQNCLNSVFKQRYFNLELIIIDGASTDGTIEILKENSHYIGYWRSENDTGIYDAMNKALKYITGKWVYFIGADDTLREEFSDLIGDLKDSFGIYYGSVWCRGKKCSGFINQYYQAKVGLYHQSMVYPAAVFKYHQYDVKYKIAADYVLNMRLNKDKRFHFIFKDYIIADFNHTGVSGENRDEELEKNKSRLILENFGPKVWIRYRFREMKAQLRKFVKRK